MSTDLVRHKLNGPTMGTRWQALVPAAAGLDVAGLTAALQAAVDRVDQQMSTWKPDSDLNRLSRAPVGAWVAVPAGLMAVLARGVWIGKASGGAFDMGLGDAVRAWGFGADPADAGRIRAAAGQQRRAAHEMLELDVAGGRARKDAALQLDLNGIAKGYGVDRLAEVLRFHGVSQALVAIDGEVRALGAQPDGRPWAVAVEAPDPAARRVHSVVEVTEAALATSGSYRHRVRVNGRDLSHTMDPGRGAPLVRSAESVTVLAEDCMSADGWATAFMVMGPELGLEMAQKMGLSVLFLMPGQERRLGTGVFAAGV